MADYYHEARRHVQSLKKTSDDSRRRAERRQELAIIDVRCCWQHGLLHTSPSHTLSSILDGR